MNKFTIHKTNNSSTLLLHLLIWLVILSFPFLMTYDETDIVTNRMLHTWFKLFLYGIVFYINYLFLVDKFFFNKKNLAFLGANIVLLGVFTFFLIEMKSILHDLFPTLDVRDKGGPPPRNSISLYLDALSFIVPIAFAMVLKVTNKWRENEAQIQEAEKVKLASELKYLKHQLQPHFFFNTINNIYALIDISTNDAKISLHKLGKLMRYLLYNTSDKYSLLKNELSFLENYIALMQLRVSDNVTVTVDFQAVNESIKIPPLLFISLVENSFKHGVDAIAPSFISVQLKVENDKIHFQCSNSFFEKTTEDTSDSGIGVNNLERRLALLYGSNFKLVNKRVEDVYYTELIIPMDNE